MLEKFHHTLPDGHDLALPKFENISAGTMRRIRRMNPADQIFTLLEEFLEEQELVDHIDPLSQTELNEIAKAWQKNSSVSVGESSASST